MINTHDRPMPDDSSARDPSDSPRETRSSGGDLYSTLFARTRAEARAAVDARIADTSATPLRSERRPNVPPGPVPAPVRPRSLAETGLSLGCLSDLVLKLTYLQGSLTGADLAAQLRLPFRVVEEPLAFLRHLRCVEVQGGESPAEFAFRYQLTDAGRARAREAFEDCRYVGPAPVSLRTYVEQCRRQSVAGIPCTRDAMQPAFSDLVLRPSLLEELGPAVCDGQALFLYGPAGNGKTLLAQRIGRFLNTSGGDIYVPYAVNVDGATVTLFDPNVHQTTDDMESFAVGPPTSTEGDDQPRDLRWRRIRRPVVITAGELTLEMLDLRFHAESGYYAAPLQVKANGGVFVIDDFGRQRVSPRELLNRWILPLAERIDYLTFATGKKFAVPFEQLTIFSTNLEPKELVDDAFLRRIRHKIAVPAPTRDEFAEIFRHGCRQRGLRLDPDCIRYLFTDRYSSARPPRWSDPQDLLEIVLSICRFRNEEPRLSRELIAQAAARFFADL